MHLRHSYGLAEALAADSSATITRSSKQNGTTHIKLNILMLTKTLIQEGSLYLVRCSGGFQQKICRQRDFVEALPVQAFSTFNPPHFIGQKSHSPMPAGSIQ